ncbi:hypothetical protein BT96DRAFT_1007590 [Gymnopus androsaceus JB14]|uniref:RING-type domain-containing protein n=1 Tax=Gymnopus androsaceus JB14 TaxID=1447944 RepID=A0A6A4GHF8_9AGAR|nr:hypothetical protein BT96DRAFT_1007590 [Gymnopus androsaceus JB14]
MPPSSTPRTIAVSRAATAPYWYPATPGSLDTEEEVKTARSRRSKTKTPAAGTNGVCRSSRLQSKVQVPTAPSLPVPSLPARKEFDTAKQEAKLAQDNLSTFIAQQKILFTCQGCKNLAFQPQVSDCGHIHCAQCIYTSRQSAVLDNDFVRCAVCNSYVLWPPVPCYQLQHYVCSLAEAAGTAVPETLPFEEIWTPRLRN